MFFKKKSAGRESDFPTLDVVYLDSACMSRRPWVVLDRMQEYYEKYPVCAGRSAHKLSHKLGQEVTKSRDIVRKFFGAKKVEQILFTRNATEGINWVSRMINFKEGDVILTTDREHNSNLVPWLRLVKEKGIVHDIIPSNQDNTFDMEAFLRKIKQHNGNIKLVSVVHTSNLDGVSIPLKEITRVSHQHGALVLADGAQAAAHHVVNVSALDVDFYATSAHKMCGPSGVGMLYVKDPDSYSQVLVGGDTVENSTYDSYDPSKSPHKYEAGLQNYPGILGFGAACTFLEKFGRSRIEDHEITLNTIVTEGLGEEISSGKLLLVGPLDPKLRGGVFTFHIPGKDSHEFAQLLDKTYDIAVRSGQHCVHSWHHANHIKGSIRASFYLYDTKEEAQKFVSAVKELLTLG